MSFCPNPNDPYYTYVVERLNKEAANIIYTANNNNPPRTTAEADSFISQYKEQTKQRTIQQQSRSREATFELLKANEQSVEKIQQKYKFVEANKDGQRDDAQRVSEKIEFFKKQNGDDFKGKDDVFYAHKGVIAHEYLTTILQKTADGDKVALKPIEQSVINLLRQNPDYADYNKGFFELKPAQFNMFQDATKLLLENAQAIQNRIDPNGTFEVRTELLLVNKEGISDDIRGEVGTADVVIFFSDGSAAIYDFKLKTMKKNKTFGFKTKLYWDIQLTNYANMLKNNYGITKIREARIIPIDSTYTKYNPNTKEYNRVENGFHALAMWNGEKVTEYLQPIPFEKETGDENFDGLLEKLYNRKAALLAEQKAEIVDMNRIKKTLEINKLTKVLESLLYHNDVNNALGTIRDIYKDFRNKMMIPEYEGGKSINELNTAYHELEIFKDIAFNLSKRIEHMPKDKQEEANAKLKNAQQVIVQLKSDLLTAMIHRLNTDKETIGSLGQGISGLGKYFNGLDSWQINIFQSFHQLYTRAEEASRIQTEQDYKRINKAQDELAKWAKENGMSTQDAYNKMYNAEKGELYHKFKKDFWSKYTEIRKKSRANEKLTDAEKAFIDDNFEINTPLLEKYVADTKKNLQEQVDLGIIDKAEADRRFTDFTEYSDPRFGNNIYKGNQNSSRQFVKPKDNISTEYLSNEYRYIQSNQGLKQYYDLYNEIMDNYREIYGRDKISYNFVPNVQRDATSLIAERGIGGFKDIWQMFKNKFVIRQQDEILGSRDIEGGEIKTIPLLYVENIRNPLNDTEKAKIEEEVAISVTRGTKEFEKEVARRIAKTEEEVGLTLKSSDIHRSLKLFVAQANQHIQLTGIEAQVKALKTIINSDVMRGFKQSPTDQKAFNTLMGKVGGMSGLPADIIESFEMFIDRLIYSKKYKNDMVVAGKYSANKMTQYAMTYFSNVVIGANIVLVGANYATAVNNMAMFGVEGVYFDKKAWRKSFKMFGMRDPKFKNAVEFIQNTTRDYLREDANRSGVNFVSKLFRSENLFWGHLKTDEAVDRAISVSMAEQWVLDSDGVIKNPNAIGARNKIINPNSPKLIDLIKRDENGNTYVEGLTLQEFGAFRSKVRKVSQRIKGMMTEKQRGMVYSSMLTAMFAHLRSWMFGMATTRFGRVEYDSVLDNLEGGRYNIAVGHVIHDGALPAIKNFLQLLTEAATMGLYKVNPYSTLDATTLSSQDNQLTTKYNEFIRLNPDMRHITKEDFAELIRNKITSAAMEIRLWMSFLLLLSALGGLDWDNEEEGNIMTWNTQQWLRRSLLELSFWLSPTSAMSIIQSPLPLYGLFKRSATILEKSILEVNYVIQGERDPKAKTGAVYHILKTTPLVNQVLSLAGYFEHYNRPKTMIEKIRFED